VVLAEDPGAIVRPHIEETVREAAFIQECRRDCCISRANRRTGSARFVPMSAATWKT